MEFWNEYKVRGTNISTRRRKTVQVTARNQSEAESIARFKGLMPPYEISYVFDITSNIEIAPPVTSGIKRMEELAAKRMKELELQKIAESFVDAKTFVQHLNNKTLKPANIEVSSSSYGDLLTVIFDNGKKITTLFSEFSGNSEDIKFAEDINRLKYDNNVRIIDVKITPIGNEDYNISFKFEEID